MTIVSSQPSGNIAATFNSAIRELRTGTGLGLRDAHDLIVKFNGRVNPGQALIDARKAIGANAHQYGGVYTSPEQLCRAAIKEYYKALDNREHGGVAADVAIKAIEAALGMSWEQGATLKKL